MYEKTSKRSLAAKVVCKREKKEEKNPISQKRTFLCNVIVVNTRKNSFGDIMAMAKFQAIKYYLWSWIWLYLKGVSFVQ